MGSLMGPLVDIMLKILNLFYNIGFHNYGIAIILLTVAVKFALYPLTLQSVQQMAAMQKIQPKFDELKKKHKDKPEKFQQETMELYKEHGINPLGGCLPILLQLPIFIALFMALTSPAFKAALAAAPHAAAFLWIPDISFKDPSYVMPVLIGISTYLSQKTMPSSASNEQTKYIMLIMPFFIAFISLKFAAGVQLYWVAQNVLTVAQQLYITVKKGKV